MKSQYAIIAIMFGLCTSFLQAIPAEQDPEAVRQRLIELYQDVSGVYYEAHSTETDRIDQYTVRSDGASVRRTFIRESLITHHGLDPEDALADWLDVAVDFVFFDGKRTSIGPMGLDTYIVHEHREYPKPWGANPAHQSSWPMIAQWAKTGTINEREEGGWMLKAPDRELHIAFDDQLRVEWVEHKYDPENPGYTRWKFDGYRPDSKDPRFPTRMVWEVKIFDQHGEIARSFESAYTLRFDFDPERVAASLPFRRPDGSVNLISPDEAHARRLARETGRTLKSVLGDPSCGPLDIRFKRYDPETGEVTNDDGTVLYNLKEIQRQVDAEMEAQSKDQSEAQI